MGYTSSYRSRRRRVNLTIMLGADQINAIEALVTAHVYKSRSDFIRQALAYFTAFVLNYIDDIKPDAIAHRVAAIRTGEARP